MTKDVEVEINLPDDIKKLLEEGKTVCLSCGYHGEDIQGEYPNLHEGYGCPRCHSPFVVVAEKKNSKRKIKVWVVIKGNGTHYYESREGDITFTPEGFLEIIKKNDVGDPKKKVLISTSSIESITIEYL